LERRREPAHEHGPDLGERYQHLDVRCLIATIINFDLVNSVTISAAQAALSENRTMADAFTVDSGLVSLNAANTIGSVAVAGISELSRLAEPAKRRRLPRLAV
jgi:hypothetical protein